jgi:hypothetical protein
MTAIPSALLATLLIAALMTFGDFVWARHVTAHRMVWGLLHGLALCLAIGLCLGLPRGRALAGGLGGAAIGLGAALSFYALAPLLRYGAMFPAWMAFWIALAFLQGRGLGDPKEPTRESLARGLAAAVASGLAFYAISGIWTKPSPGGPDYPRHFFSWGFAFLPGFLALGVRRSHRTETALTRG